MYTKEQLIDIGWKYYNTTNKVPAAKKFTKSAGYVSGDWVYKEFGDWASFIEACNFPKEDLTRKARGTHYKNALLIEDKKQNKNVFITLKYRALLKNIGCVSILKIII